MVKIAKMKVHVPTVNLFGVPVANVTMDETLDIVNQAIENDEQLHHCVVNAGKIVHMQKDTELAKSVVGADLINADGMAVVWASKLCKKALPERVTGIDLMIKLVKLAHEKGHSCYFLGAKNEIVKKVVDIYSEQYSKDVIAGYNDGYFSDNEAPDIAAKIRESGANILFVAITSPKKEIFLNRNKKLLSSVNMIMGVGGSFDVIAGKVDRAPLWMQKAGLEWFYRFIQEPQRMWKRYLIGNWNFFKLTVKEMTKKRRALITSS